MGHHRVASGSLYLLTIKALDSGDPRPKKEQRAMIKNLPISQASQVLIHDFEKHIKIIGYQKMSSSGLRELLHRIENEGKQVDEITSEDIKAHHEFLLTRPNYSRAGGLSSATINGYLFTIKLFFNYTQKVGLIKINPMSVLSFPQRVSRQRSVLNKSEISQLYEVCKSDQERALLSLFYGCGLRKSEAVKLNTKDVDLRGKWLYVRSGKGKKRRVVPLSESVARDLKSYQFNERSKQESRWTKASDRKAFMLNKVGTRMKGNSFWKSFKNILSRTTIKKQISLHHLRHTIATHLLASGMSIEQVRDFLGHTHLESTQIYTRVKTNQLKI